MLGHSTLNFKHITYRITVTQRLVKNVHIRSRNIIDWEKLGHDCSLRVVVTGWPPEDRTEDGTQRPSKNSLVLKLSFNLENLFILIILCPKFSHT